MLSIGALSRATGIPVETLRTWEARYGFPEPRRKPSGHRVYAASVVPRLRRVSEALGRGLRAGDIVAASDEELTALLEATVPPGRAARPAADQTTPAGPADLDVLLAAVRAFDAERLTRVLLGGLARLGVVEFLQSRVGPLLRTVGEAWADGRLDVSHEHFLSARVGDLLRAARLPYEDRATGPLVLLLTLPGEQHELGLETAGLVLSAAGCRLLMLGTEVPIEQVAPLADDLGAVAVAVAVSRFSAGRATQEALAWLRERLPLRIGLLAGGEGAPAEQAGVLVVRDLLALDAWARRAVAAGARAG